MIATAAATVTTAGTASQSEAALQTIAVLYRELPTQGVPAGVESDATVLFSASGSLEHPSIDLTAPAVLRAKDHLARTCQANGLTIGVIAQGG